MSSTLARGFSARLRMVLEKNWFDSARRPLSTLRTRDRYVMLGVPSAEAVATMAGTTPSKHKRRSSSVSSLSTGAVPDLGSCLWARSLVVELGDHDFARHVLSGDQTLQEGPIGAVGFVDGGEEGVAEPGRQGPV